MLYLLDSDHFSLMYWKTAEGKRIEERLRHVPLDDYGISIVTYMEATKGWFAEVARAHTPVEEVTAFSKLQANLEFCTTFAIWGYTPEAAAICADLKAQKVRVGTQDMRIASIVLANNATLLTRNTQDFARVPNLRFEDWSV